MSSKSTRVDRGLRYSVCCHGTSRKECKTPSKNRDIENAISNEQAGTSSQVYIYIINEISVV